MPTAQTNLRAAIVPDSITPELKSFISRYIRSVEQLEILFLVSSDPSKTWTVKEVFRVVQSSERSVTECLEGFLQNNFLVKESVGYRFAPKSDQISQSIDHLARAYHERRVSVIQAIYQKPAEGIQNFADAFRLKKES